LDNAGVVLPMMVVMVVMTMMMTMMLMLMLSQPAVSASGALGVCGGVCGAGGDPGGGRLGDHQGGLQREGRATAATHAGKAGIKYLPLPITLERGPDDCQIEKQVFLPSITHGTSIIPTRFCLSDVWTNQVVRVAFVETDEVSGEETSGEMVVVKGFGKRPDGGPGIAEASGKIQPEVGMRATNEA
jgi:hypothetical protein